MTGNKQHDDQQSRIQYSMPGILHFLQTEWTRFEIDRAQWEIDRAELQARIAFLQGERKGQENLKHDLVRRIKMLEYALKQERSKYHKLKYGTDLEQGAITPPNFDKDSKEEQNIQESLHNANSNGNWKQGRQLLRQYLQEIGYTDTIIDVRSTRVRQLLGLQPLTDPGDSRSLVNGEVQGTKRPAESHPRRATGKKLPTSIAESALINTEESIMATFDFLSPENVEDEDNLSDGENEENQGDDDERIPNMVKRPKTTKPNMGNESMAGIEDVVADPDTEEALAEFDFLVSENNDGAGGARSQDRKDLSPNEEWDVDQQLLSKLKEQYKRERQKDKKAGQGHASDRPRRSTLQAMLVNLDNEDDLPALQSGSQSPPRINSGNLNDMDETAGCQAMMGVLGNDDDALEAALGLGELAGLTVSNDADALTYDISPNKDIHRKTWNAKYTLRSHFDGIRALVFHPVEPVLITAAEDHMLKLWNLQKTVPAKRNASLDVEPVYTFRAHNGPVLCLAMSPTGESCYSGGVDGTIRCWNIPNSNIDPYDSFDPSVLQATLAEHTDAVWSLAMHSSKMQLLSCSADSTIKLWNPTGKSPLLSSFRVDAETGVPTSVDFVRCEPNHMVVAYTSSNAYVFDLEKGRPVVTLECKTNDQTVGSQINRVVCHPTLPVTITAHEDRHIRFFDNNSGKMIHSMVAHLDAVTSLAVDPSGLYLLSGSHDCSIRLWNLDSKTCVQEITSHRKKFDESIHDVTFHPSKPFIASAGADALAKVFV